jgi:hypothetical protein
MAINKNKLGYTYRFKRGSMDVFKRALDSSRYGIHQRHDSLMAEEYGFSIWLYDMLESKIIQELFRGDR